MVNVTIYSIHGSYGFDQVESVLHHKLGVPATGSGKTLEWLRGL